MVSRPVVIVLTIRFWGCGLGFTLLLTVSLDMLHHNLETWRAQMVPRVSKLWEA